MNSAAATNPPTAAPVRLIHGCAWVQARGSTLLPRFFPSREIVREIA